ncbi:MAG TPA: hypothetical protein VGC41_29170 [Kofleriaceae bacterium]
MRKQDALFLGLAAGTIAFAIAFAYSAFTAESVLWYYPVDHRWAFEVKPHGVAMDFYGRVIQASLAWCAGFVVTVVIAQRVKTAAPRAIFLFGAWAITATLFVMAFYAWTLHVRVPVPAAIPSGYQPH